MPDRPALPSPIQRADEYMHDIATSLRQLLDGGPSSQASDVVKVGPDERVVPLSEPAPTVDIRHIGGGWYELTVDGEPSGDKIQGREAAEAAAADLRGA